MSPAVGWIRAASLGVRCLAAAGADGVSRPLKAPPEGNRCISGMGRREVEVTYRGLNFSLDETKLGLRAARLVCYDVYCDMGCCGIFHFPLL